MTESMLVRIIRQPSEASIDGIMLSQFEVGIVYALPVELATVMIVEGWAYPVTESAEPKLPEIKFNLVGPRERRRRVYTNSALRTELGIAADRRRRK